MIAKIALAAVLGVACHSVQKVVTLAPPAPKTVVIYVRDSSAPTHSKYLADIRPNGQTKVDPALPWVAEFKPPAIYAEWWKEIAACQKRELPTELLPKIHYVEVNAESFRLALEVSETYGLSDPESLTIFLAQSVVENKVIVTHEFSHFLDFWNAVDEGKDYHPYTTFEECNLHVHYPN